MDNLNEYKAMFSQVHTDVTVDMEAYKKMNNKKTGKRKILTAAVVICIVLAGFGTVYAADFFGLRSQKLENPQEIYIPEEQEDGTVEERQEIVDTVSLQGYVDSAEHKAVSEWDDFVSSYDQDMELLSQVGNDPTGLGIEYEQYGVYTQEMADKLDEILERYNLEKHTSSEIFSSADELYQMAGTESFLRDKNTVYGGYIYEDGTFLYDGEYQGLSYQMQNSKKGTFTYVLLNIGNLDDYQEWAYQTESGITVTISTSDYKSLITADLDTSFFSVNILPDLGSVPITDELLEEFADSIDYNKLN